MECVQAKTIFHGIAMGKIRVWNKEEYHVKRVHNDSPMEQETRYEQAKEKAMQELLALYQKAIKEVGELNAQVFEVHAMMLEDEDYNDSVKNMIHTQNVSAEYAVARTGEIFSQMFSEMGDEYFQTRSIDVKDISQRVVSILMGKEPMMEVEEEPSIIVADELTPSETIQMDKSKILAFVTRHGSKNSHTAILARAMNIPAITGVEISSGWDGKFGVVDGASGRLYIEPEERILEELVQRQENERKNREILARLKDQETVSKSGKKIHLYANIGNQSDMASVLANDAEGIGLFRTEFLYLEREDYPTEQEQFLVYQYVAETMGGKKVIIRTLDIGADKQVDYFGLEKEENPALGYRAIRICLDRTQIFKTQLRAILRAAAYGNISVMFPMIISVKEVQQAKRLLRQVKEELESEGIEFGDVEIGIMIETPAAVMMSDELAKEVDFFSIGTNDLTQYTLAIDRQNPKLDDIYEPHHPAILRMIKMVVENGHAGGAWVGICGELGADPELMQMFLDMGVDEVSVAPPLVLQVRQIVRECE